MITGISLVVTTSHHLFLCRFHNLPSMKWKWNAQLPITSNPCSKSTSSRGTCGLQVPEPGSQPLLGIVLGNLYELLTVQLSALGLKQQGTASFPHLRVKLLLPSDGRGTITAAQTAPSGNEDTQQGPWQFPCASSALAAATSYWCSPVHAPSSCSPPRQEASTSSHSAGTSS